MTHAHDCIDPHHHVHDAQDFVSAVERACQERGLRLTPIRARVLGLVADAGKPVKAYDLLEQIRSRADVLIDTSAMSPHDLRAEIARLDELLLDACARML